MIMRSRELKNNDEDDERNQILVNWVEINISFRMKKKSADGTEVVKNDDDDYDDGCSDDGDDLDGDDDDDIFAPHWILLEDVVVS